MCDSSQRHGARHDLPRASEIRDAHDVDHADNEEHVNSDLLSNSEDLDLKVAL